MILSIYLFINLLMIYFNLEGCAFSFGGCWSENEHHVFVTNSSCSLRRVSDLVWNVSNLTWKWCISARFCDLSGWHHVLRTRVPSEAPWFAKSSASPSALSLRCLNWLLCYPRLALNIGNVINYGSLSTKSCRSGMVRVEKRCGACAWLA